MEYASERCSEIHAAATSRPEVVKDILTDAPHPGPLCSGGTGGLWMAELLPPAVENGWLPKRPSINRRTGVTMPISRHSSHLARSMLRLTLPLLPELLCAAML